MHVAIVHDYLNQYGGAERVLEALHDLYPNAPVYTSIYDPRTMPSAYHSWDIRTSWMQHLPGWRRYFRHYMPLYPSAFESFDLSGYDLIVSSSSAFAKGVIPPPGTCHICYCHTPMRFAWRTDSYVEREHIKGLQRAILSILLTYVRLWDTVGAARVDAFVTNSREVARRVHRYYGRDATVIPPPVDLATYSPQEPDDFYLAGGRLIPYKRLDLAVRAFTALGLPLKVFGDGRDRAALESIAGSNVTFLGYVSEAERQELFARCRAFVFPGEEDFGITPLEAMAAGRPVIAYAAGGALDSVIEGRTGWFFHEPTPAALAATVAMSHTSSVEAMGIRQHAEDFGRVVFLRRMRDFITSVMKPAPGSS
ncbi:MAG: glycosyltransferase family 4 protein [Chloroflexi bacterium AL-W]|nr:glycosyltransferase family 4 protein [Chloroflexi bacterium AL-N1]NOK65425.1 glycosyltransferase family 4 protein [Chloroflexi bacterium AL-N10]NOK72309.1 glycosyltransferase family 4 protein [Chloroflexi bacterium AL-N5]NOK79604.1 glycosyltransferase family 4 protein [Chloroflexi bacterium AL-W]NOK87520.1 glycosyltransferase family 4 protein [Chloroflexi bacterium AL-N15]